MCCGFFYRCLTLGNNCTVISRIIEKIREFITKSLEVNTLYYLLVYIQENSRVVDH